MHNPTEHTARQSRLKTQQQHRELVSSNHVRNAPHQQGTIAQLAEKLGISKSEVRRLKREGLLEKAINTHNSSR